MFIDVVGKDQSGKPITITVNMSQVAFIVENYVHMSSGAHFELDEESLKKVNLEISPKTKNKKNNKPDDELLKLFNELHLLVKGKGKVTFTLKREKQLKDLLDPNKHRMTKEDLIRAATNIGNNEWLQGDNPNGIRYGKIDFLLRPEKAQQYAEVEEKKKKAMF